MVDMAVVQRQPNEVGIHAIRGGNIVGEHDALFAGDNEVLTISHQAQSRGIFASGSIAAAKYLVKQNQDFIIWTACWDNSINIIIHNIN